MIAELSSPEPEPEPEPAKRSSCKISGTCAPLNCKCGQQLQQIQTTETATATATAALMIRLSGRQLPSLTYANVLDFQPPGGNICAAYVAYA